MTQEKLKQFLDACFDAKRLIEKLPDLPDGMKPRQVHVLDAVNEIQKKQGFCRVSDISSEHNAAEHHQAGAGTGGEKASRETGG